MCNPSSTDLIMSNEQEMVSDIVIDSPLGKSDHALLTFTFNAYLDGSNTEKIIYKYDKADYKKMIEIMTLEWNSVLENSSVDKQWQCFHSKHLSAVDECVPKTYVKPSQNRKIIKSLSLK